MLNFRAFVQQLILFFFVSTVRSLEQARATGNFGEGSDLGLGMNDSSRESDSSDIDDGGSNNGSIHRSKKMKTNSNY